MTEFFPNALGDVSLAQQLQAITRRLDALEHFARHGVLPPPEPKQIDFGPELARVEEVYQRKKYQFQARLRAAVLMNYQGLSYGSNLTNSITRAQGAISGMAKAYATPEQVIEDVPRAAAAGITREDEAYKNLREFEGIKHRLDPRRESEHPETRHARLKALFELRARHTQDLLASTELPPVPQELLDKLADIKAGRARR